MEKEKIFEYLDEVRDSGVMNMFAAPQHLQERFGMEKKEARELVTEWMKRS